MEKLYVKILKKWPIMLIYLALLLLTLYVVPRFWVISVRIFGARTYSLSYLVTFTILVALLIIIIREDIINREIKDIFRYFWLILIGWTTVAIAHKLSSPWDKLHVPEYVLVGCITFRIVYHHLKTTTIYPAIFIAIIGFAFLEECIQNTLPGRNFELTDLAIDAVSVLLALAIMGLTVKPELDEGMPQYILRQFFHVKKEYIYTNLHFLFFKVRSKIRNLFR